MRILRSNSSRYLRLLPAVALLAVLGLAVAGCGGASGSSASATKSGVAGAQHTTGSAAVTTHKVKGLGVVLAKPNGRTLYVFMKDARKHVTCVKADQNCPSFWPPLKWKGAGKPKAGGTAKTSLLAWDKDPDGGKVLTYNKWPLYTYSGDSAAGQANGENKNLNGGKWYVISPKGTLIKHAKTSGGGGGTTTKSWG